MALPKPRGKGRKEEISLDDAATHLLEECRMVLPGIQALFGFQLIAVFNQGFGEKLSHAQQLVHLAAIVLTTLAMALVMTPAALHRQAEPTSVSERFLWIASNVVLHNDGAAAALAIALVAVFFFLWLVLPRRERR